MIKVISNGNLPKYKVKCSFCNSILEFDKTDEIMKYTPDQAWYGNCTDWMIKCPVCEHMVPTRSITDEDYYDWRMK